MDLEEIDLQRAWLVTFVGGVAAVVSGALLFPTSFRDGFLWRYFWGPVVADAHGVGCAARTNGETVIGECSGTFVASPGYTMVSTISYALVLVFLLAGVYLLLERLEIELTNASFYAFVPFVPFGGALRTVEDANVELLAEGAAPIPFPYSALIISPFIYFVIFAITLASLLVGVLAVKRNLVDRYEYVVAGAGSVFLVGTLAYLSWLAISTDLLGFNWEVPVITLGGATILAAITWVLTQKYTPEINAGTGFVGVVIVWGHAVDGVANVLSLDWGERLGLPNYTPKHVVNEAIHTYTGLIQPAWLTDLIGQTWPFIFVKVGAAVVVVYLFDDEILTESPRYSYLMLIAVLAVGLGPGTRDFLRATFGI